MVFLEGSFDLFFLAPVHTKLFLFRNRLLFFGKAANPAFQKCSFSFRMKSEILENDDVTCAGKSHNRTIMISWCRPDNNREFKQPSVFERRASTGSGRFAIFGRDFDQIV